LWTGDAGLQYDWSRSVKVTVGGWKALRHVDQLHTVRARGGAVACTPPSVECYPANAAAAAAAAEDDDR